MNPGGFTRKLGERVGNGQCANEITRHAYHAVVKSVNISSRSGGEMYSDGIVGREAPLGASYRKESSKLLCPTAIADKIEPSC